MSPVKLGFGEQYSDSSGWRWLVQLDTEETGGQFIKVTLAGDDLLFSPNDISPRALARAFTEIADALGFELMDEDIEAARQIAEDAGMFEEEPR